jgi:D-amino peptidase
MNVLINTDMEGCAGIFHRELQISNPTQLEFARSLRLATGEVIAAVEGAKTAGAKEIWIEALHDIDMEMLPEGLQVIRGKHLWDTVFKENQFDAMILIGQHGGAHDIDSALAHTCLPSWQIEEGADLQQGWIGQIAPQLAGLKPGEFSTVRNVWLNDRLTGESGLIIAIAASFGVPTVCESGDSHACAEAKELVPEVETVPVKWGYHFRAARMLSPAEARKRIREGVQKALKRRNEIPCMEDGPQTLRVQYVHPERADRTERIASVERLDDFTISTTAPSGKDLAAAIAILFARPSDALSEPTFPESIPLPHWLQKRVEQS